MDNVTNYLPAPYYTETKYNIPRKLFDEAASAINTEISTTNLVPGVGGIYKCEVDYSGFISDVMLQYINIELSASTGEYKMMLEEAKKSVETGALSKICLAWETMFLVSQTLAIAVFNASINPATTLPFVPPNAAYPVVEDYSTAVDGSISADTPSILGDAIQKFMVSAFGSFGL